MISIKSQREIDKMKRAGEVVARVHLRMEELVAPGVTTAELNRAALEIIQGAGAIPSFLGYPSPYGGIDFPGAICASVNEEVIHGLPGPRVLNEGDIISVDVGAILDGWHGDAARTQHAEHGNGDAPGEEALLPHGVHVFEDRRIDRSIVERQRHFEDGQHHADPQDAEHPIKRAVQLPSVPRTQRKADGGKEERAPKVL